MFLFLCFISLASLVIGFYSGRRKSQREENQGEAIVRKNLIEYCKQSTAFCLNNITLAYKDGSTQVDHILITQNGVLVIETKHYSGWIFAHEKQKEWTQIIFKFKKRFQSPIFQNLKHVRAVQQLLDFIPRDHVQSLVVFTGEAEFKTAMPPGVIHANELTRYIDNLRAGSISENRVQFCVGRIECKRFELTEQTDIDHQAYLEKKYGYQ